MPVLQCPSGKQQRSAQPCLLCGWKNPEPAAVCQSLGSPQPRDNPGRCCRGAMEPGSRRGGPQMASLQRQGWQQLAALPCIPLHAQGTCCWVRAGDGLELVVSVKHTENEHFYDVWNTVSHHRQVVVNPFSRTGPLVQKSVSCWWLCMDRQHQHLTAPAPYLWLQLSSCSSEAEPTAGTLQQEVWEIPCVPCTPRGELAEGRKGALDQGHSTIPALPGALVLLWEQWPRSRVGI